MSGMGFFMGHLPLLPPNQQYQSAEGNSVHGPQSVPWSHSFSIHHQIPGWSLHRFFSATQF